ncbi:hypothetical protein LQZ19_16130 [Treponema primitia]|uniref:hypothetical protein n=1 Tax=Treponema primitia TaxID=88058 RepID=UPI00397F8559
MFVQKVRALFSILVFSLFLSSCGEMDDVFSSHFPSQGTYWVNALIDGDYTLDEYSAVNQNSKIRPFFVNSVVNDPDVRGLMVFVQDLSGATVSRKVQYVLSTDTQTKQVEEKDLLGTSEDGENSRKDYPEDPPPESLTAGPDKTSSAEEKTDGTALSAEKGETDTAVITEIGSKAEGTSSTADTPADHPTVSEDQVLLVKHLEQYLPAFRIFENLKIGRYNLIFQVLGDKDVLYRTSKSIYFLADANFTLGEVQSYLPGTPTGDRLIPPGINVVLETAISADTRLDPYVIWYSGKKVIAQGRNSDGANYLLWKTPEQTGFHIIKAEVFPLLAGDNAPDSMRGKVKELSLAISSKTERMRYFDSFSKSFTNWYQFWGNLDDAISPGNPEKQLLPLVAHEPCWIPFAGIYGLFIGPNDSYALPGKSLSLSEQEQGKGRIFFHLVPLAEGSVLTATFNSKDGLPAAVLGLSLARETSSQNAGGNLKLRLSSNDNSENESPEEILALNPEELNAFISFVVDFEITPDHISASLLLENPARETELVTLALAEPINGEGTIRIGGTDHSTGNKGNTKWPGFDKNGNPNNGILILNELALSYTRLPISKDADEPEPEPENNPDQKLKSIQ